MKENLHTHPYIRKAYAIWQDRVSNQPANHRKIYERELIYLCHFGSSHEMSVALRVLAHSIHEPFDRFLTTALLSINQAVSADTGDYIAADTRTFRSTKVTGEFRALGSSGPMKGGK